MLIKIQFPGPPLIGLLVDYYGAFSYPFYYAGIGFGLGFVFNILSEFCRTDGVQTYDLN